MTTLPALPADLNLGPNIAEWLRLIYSPGEIIELRALEYQDNPKYPSCTVSGYFDGEHLDELIRHANQLTGRAKGVYVTCNPLIPDLLARSCNRVQKRPKSTAADLDVARRRSLVFDMDPVRRPPDVSATDEEKARAWVRVRELTGHLTGRGWPSPALVDSGNGFYAYYRIDLPVDDGGGVERVLKAADSLFSTDQVKVDTKLFNPARIIKLPGTWARKGDSIQTRPHRLSGVVSRPDPWNVVPTELLEALALEAPQAPTVNGGRARPPSQSATSPAGTNRAPATSTPESRARSYVFAQGFPDSIEGQDGHGVLYRVACELIDGFGLSYEQASPIFSEWNQTKAQPPEEEAQLHHKLADAIKNHPAPSLKRLNAERNGVESKPAMRKSAAPETSDSSFPRLDSGRWVQATDRDPANYGQVVEDLGDRARVHFISPGGHENTPTLHKSDLRNMDGSELETVDSQEWQPLRTSKPPRQLPFPVEVFPPPLGQFCREVATTTLAAIDLAGAAMLAAAGAAIGHSVQIRLKNGWEEPALLFLILVAKPGKAKTPVLRYVLRAQDEIDQRLRRESSEARESWLEKKRAHDEKPGAAEPPGPEPPQLRAVVRDITRESLVLVLKDNAHGVLHAPDEASGWVASFNEYKGKGGSDRQFWLSLWSCQSISSDRKGGRESNNVPFPFCSMLGGIQPGMLSALKEDRGRDDGFLDRIMFCYPEDSAYPRQRWTEEQLSEATERAWTEAVARLHAAPMHWYEEQEAFRPHFVSFTPEAKKIWIEWFNGLSAESESPDFPDRHAGAWSKLRAHAARFALILSRLRWACDPPPIVTTSGRGENSWELTVGGGGPPPGPVEEEDVVGAIELANYFKSQLLRVSYEMTDGVGSMDAKELLDWIKRHRPASFREAEVGGHLRRFRDNPKALSEAIKAVGAVGAIRPKHEPRDPSRRGPKPSPAYEVHPDLLRSPDNSGNSDNSEPEPHDDPNGGINGNSGRTPENPEADREVIEL